MEINAVNAKRDPEIREQYIASSETFILRSAGKVCHRRITRSDDEWSAALIAFNEAIDGYDESKGDFNGFAYRVIQRRLIDFIRKEQRHDSEVTVEPYVFDGNVDDDPSSLQMEVAEKSGTMSTEDETSSRMSAADEIAAVQKILAQYGFSFFDIADCSPKARKTKHQCARVIRILLQNEDILDSMRETHTLPAFRIIQKAKVTDNEKIPPKILERHRRYIIAVTEILSGEYPILSSYLQEIRKEMRS